MSNKTNEEKLRILQERLATIQKKKDTEKQVEVEKTQPVSPVFKEELVNQPEIEPISKTPRKPRNNNGTFKYFIIFFVIALVGYASTQFIDFNSLFSSDETTEENETVTDIIYNKSSFNGNYLIILNSFEDQNVANAESQKYITDGYNCEVLQLSGVSNSEEEIFQTYIGPFNKLEEANQFLNSTKEVSEIGKVIELQ